MHQREDRLEAAIAAMVAESGLPEHVVRRLIEFEVARDPGVLERLAVAA